MQKGQSLLPRGTHAHNSRFFKSMLEVGPKKKLARGKRTRAQKLVARGRHVSAICAMSLSGVLECQFENGSVNGVTFRNFIEKSLLPHLMPFNGTNEHSVVVMDNAAIHHVEGISELIESVGALLIFLPPYSPDLDPIEEAFSSVKSYLKANEAILQVSGDIESVLLAAFTNISADDCRACLGIYVPFRLLLTQSGTKFPNILMTHTFSSM